MTSPTAHELVQSAEQAGYQVLATEHPRSRRWVLTLRDTAGMSIMLAVHARPLISATDVLDLAELVRVRRMHRGILWAYGGVFSAGAHQTCRELGAALLLCTALPPATDGNAPSRS